MSHHILSYSSTQFVDLLFQELGRGKQQAKDLYKQFVRSGSFFPTPASFANAPLLFQEMRERVDSQIDPIVRSVRDEESGTEKFLIRTHDGYEIESVILPMKNKTTLCLSSQIGCRMGCSFCETGKRGLVRHLSVKEIVEQFFHAWFTLHQDVKNVVFMGMGEPFDTFDNVLKAFYIFSDHHGIGLGRKNITISTCGHVDGIHRLASLSGLLPNLAVSLNASHDELRSKLMPINRKWNLASLKEALLHFTSVQGREILIAYVLMDGVNDSVMQAKQLALFLQDIPVKINVIPYNCPDGGALYRTPSLEVQNRFLQTLRAAGQKAFLRRSKGEHIMAGCGQLGTHDTQSGVRPFR